MLCNVCRVILCLAYEIIFFLSNFRKSLLSKHSLIRSTFVTDQSVIRWLTGEPSRFHVTDLYNVTPSKQYIPQHIQSDTNSGWERFVCIRARVLLQIKSDLLTLDLRVKFYGSRPFYSCVLSYLPCCFALAGKLVYPCNPQKWAGGSLVFLAGSTCWISLRERGKTE